MDRLSALAEAAGAGDRAALAALVAATQAEVWRLCAHLGDPASADDLTQEVYLRALRALPAYRAEASARTWLLAIARNTVADAVRQRTRRRRLDRLVPRRPSRTVDATGAADLALLVRGLPDDRREAFTLTQVLGLSYGEAAEVCACPIGTIRSRVARARSDLVTALSADDQAQTGRAFTGSRASKSS